MSEEYSDKRVEPTGGDEPAAAEPTSGGADTPPPPPPTAESGGDSGSDGKGLMLVLSYLWILALIPLLVEKDDAEVQWHAKNGLVWTIAEFLMHVVLTILGTFTAFLGCFLGPVLMLAWLIVRVMGIMKALKGERMELPVLADFNEKF